MGHCFCDTILDFCDPDQTKVLQTYRELKEMYPADPSAPTITQTPVFGGGDKLDGAAVAEAEKPTQRSIAPVDPQPR